MAMPMADDSIDKSEYGEYLGVIANLIGGSMLRKG